MNLIETRQIYLDDDAVESATIEERIKLIKRIPWKQEPFLKQSWPNWLHHMAPYAGRITPQIAHWLIRSFSQTNDIILDPFCGIGTIPLEANLLNRNSVGIDLNPYAFHVANAKMDRTDLHDHIKYLEEIRIKHSEEFINGIPSWVLDFYNRDTLIETLFLINKLKQDKKWFILGCLLGVAQGHRIGHLSKPSALTLPYRPKDNDPGEYKDVKPRLISKVKRMYRNGFPLKPVGKIFCRDCRCIPLKDNSVDCVITSPPYLDNLDYVSANRLRLALLGYYGEKSIQLSKLLKYKEEPYIDMMSSVILEISRVLKPKGGLVLVVGDVHKGKKSIITSELLKKPIGDAKMKVIDEVVDNIPFNRSVQRTPRIKADLSNERLDRLLIVSNTK